MFIHHWSIFYSLTHVGEFSVLDLRVFLVGLGLMSDIFWRVHGNQDPKINLYWSQYPKTSNSSVIRPIAHLIRPSIFFQDQLIQNYHPSQLHSVLVELPFTMSPNQSIKFSPSRIWISSIFAKKVTGYLTSVFPTSMKKRPVICA